MKNFRKIREEVYEKITESHTRSAIRILIRQARFWPGIYLEALLQSARWHRLENQYHQGLIDQGQYEKGQNQVNRSLLYLVRHPYLNRMNGFLLSIMIALGVFGVLVIGLPQLMAGKQHPLQEPIRAEAHQGQVMVGHFLRCEENGLPAAEITLVNQSLNPALISQILIEQQLYPYKAILAEPVSVSMGWKIVLPLVSGSKVYQLPDPILLPPGEAFRFRLVFASGSGSKIFAPADIGLYRLKLQFGNRNQWTEGLRFQLPFDQSQSSTQAPLLST